MSSKRCEAVKARAGALPQAGRVHRGLQRWHRRLELWGDERQRVVLDTQVLVPLLGTGRAETPTIQNPLKIGPRTPPGSKRTSFPSRGQPWRRGAPPKSNYRCLNWASSE